MNICKNVKHIKTPDIIEYTPRIMSQIKNSLDKIDRLILNHQYDDVIQVCSELYINKSPNSKYLDHILNAYKQSGNVNKSAIKNTISHFQKLLNYTPPQTPEFCILHNEIGMYYANCNDHKRAIHHFKQVLVVKNDIPDVFNNIAVCHIALKEYAAALVCLNISIRLHECDNVYSRIGEVNLYMKRYDASIKAYKSVRKPSDMVLYNSCFPYLATKQFLIGYKLYESRLKRNDISPQTNQIARVEIPSIPYWNGTDICRHLLIIYEQGIGDNIQYFRFIIELSNKFPDLRITYFCKSTISHLFNVQPYNNIIIRDDSAPTDISVYDRKIYIMSLPYILKLQTITLNTINYITEDVSNIAVWQEKLSVYTTKLKVGILYSGLLISYIDKQIKLSDFKDICTDDRIQTFCLHKMDDNILSDFSSIIFADKIMTYDIDKHKSFFDTISILRNIDVLVTIDTSIAHLAGVMGIKTLLLIGYTSEWRWFDTDDKIWYESVEIIRMVEQKPLSNLLPRIKNLLISEYKDKYSKHPDTM